MAAGYLSEGAYIRSTNDIVVEVLQDEVPDEGPPHHDVVEDSPVRCVECDLEERCRKFINS